MQSRIPSAVHPAKAVVVDSFKVNDGVLTVFRMPEHSLWQEDYFYTVLQEARTAYRRYGPVAPFDDHDPYATTFLARSIQKRGHGDIVEEWMSVRFVPYTSAVEVDDLSYIVGGGRPIAEAMQQHLFGGDPEWRKGGVSISRVCGIAPRISRGITKGFELISPHLQFGFEAFVAINRCFFAATRNQFKYVSGLFRPELIGKSLRICLPEVGVVPRFTTADEILPQVAPCGLSNSVTSKYLYPGYFYATIAFVDCIKRLYQLEILSRTVIENACRSLESFLTLEGTSKAYLDIGGFSKFLTVDEQLPDSKITGAELRAILDREVPDGPRLYLMAVPDWANSLALAKNRVFV